MNRRQFCNGLGWAALVGLSGCLQLSTPREDENGPGTSETAVGTASLPIRVWLKATGTPETESTNPIRYGNLTDDEQSLVRTVLDQGEYTAAPESYHPAVDAFRRRVEERTNGGETLRVYLSYQGTWYRVGFAEGDHVIAHPDH